MKQFNLGLVLTLLFLGIFVPQALAGSGQIQIFGAAVKDGIAISRSVKVKLIYQLSADSLQASQSGILLSPKGSQQDFKNTEDCRKRDNNPTGCNSMEVCVFSQESGLCLNRSSAEGKNSQSIQNIKVSAQPKLEPKFFRIANSLPELNTIIAQEKIFEKSGMEIDWQLSEGNGQKTVYAQFQGKRWEEPVSASVILEEKIKSTPAITITEKRGFFANFFNKLWQMVRGIFRK